jgi:hypothetical protein
MIVSFCKEAKIRRDFMAAFAAQFNALASSPAVDLDGLVLRTLDTLSMRALNRGIFTQLLGRSDISGRVQQRIQAVVTPGNAAHQSLPSTASLPPGKEQFNDRAALLNM